MDLCREHFCRWLSLALGFLMALGWAAEQSRFAAVCAGIRADTVRLHIRAESDAVADQSRKLKVRDAVLVQAARLCAGANSSAQAQAVLVRNLPRLARTAQNALVHSGKAAGVKAALRPAVFDTTQYGSRTLPAGEYTALQLTIGAGAGKNWWCCLYPALCTAAAGACYDTPAENAVVCGSGYEVRFALVEWWQKLRAGK